MGLIMERPTTKWTVNTDQDTVELNANTLLDALLGKVLQSPKADFDELIINFGRFLQSRDLFGDMKFNQLIGMSFAVGYYYRVFLEKNDVEISITDTSNVTNQEETNETEVEPEEESDGQMVSELSDESNSQEDGDSVS